MSRKLVTATLAAVIPGASALGLWSAITGFFKSGGLFHALLGIDALGDLYQMFSGEQEESGFVWYAILLGIVCLNILSVGFVGFVVFVLAAYCAVKAKIFPMNRQ